MPLSKIDSDSLSAPLTVPAGSAAAPAITTTGDTNTGIFFPAADTIAFAEGGAEAVRIDASGNVGIGTSSPTSRLHLVNSSANCTAIIDGQNATARGAYITLRKGGTDTSYIGQASAILGGASTSNDLLLWAEGATNQLFYTNGSERMRINSSGSTFFNCTASPTSNSSGPGGLNALISSGDVFNIKHTADGNNVFNIWQTGTAAFNAITFFKGSSQTGIGQILGTTSSTAYQTSSDYRLKENITPMTGALDKVAQLKPVTYKWKVDGSDGQGFIAHELQAVVPDCVSGEKDQVNKDGSIKPQGIDTSFLVATLTAAIQELKAIVDAQGAEIAALKGTP